MLVLRKTGSTIRSVIKKTTFNNACRRLNFISLKLKHDINQYLPLACIIYGQEYIHTGARCSSVVRAFAQGAMGRRIDPSWGGPIELFLVPASAP